MKTLTCPKCGSWNYTGNNRDRATCPKCKGKVRISFNRKYQKKLQSSPAAQSRPVAQSRDAADLLIEALEKTGPGSPGTASSRFRKKPAAEVILSTDSRDVENPREIILGPGLTVYKGRRIRQELFGRLIREQKFELLPLDQLGPAAPVFQREARKVVIPERSRWPYIV